MCSAGLWAAVGKVQAVELSGRFYTRKRKPVGSEVRGPTGEGREEEEDPPQTPPSEDTCGPLLRNSPLRALMQQPLCGPAAACLSRGRPWNSVWLLRTTSGRFSTESSFRTDCGGPALIPRRVQ